MNDEGSVLPQNDIDALFKQATGKDIASAPSSTPQPATSPPSSSAEPLQREEPAAPSVTPAPTPSGNALKNIEATVADLAGRITKLEADISRFSRNGKGSADFSLPVRRLSQKLGVVANGVRKVNSQVVRIQRGLKGTPGYSLRSGFTCESCGSQSFVAIPMRCTSCGSEGWWGWWPREE